MLVWHDTQERIDILLSEIRNLQTNIIYVLKQPVLYKPLRYEEESVWGLYLDKSDSDNKDRIPPSGQQELLESQQERIKKSSSVFDDAKLAEEWTILYPEPTQTISKFFTSTDEKRDSKKEKLITELEEKIAQIWTSSAWGRTQRRYYHQLRGLQVIKQQLVKDRITLSRHALHTSFSNPKTKIFDSQKSARFLVLRMGILHRLAGYIDRFRNHQQQFGKSFDSSFQDHPRPYVERRRDMAMYMDFLSDRCRDIRDHMQHFLRYSGVKVTGKNNGLILHGWVHHRQARTEILYDEVSPSGENSIDYVSTHFYAPDRPDLQPSIAHEVAHGILRSQFANLTTTSKPEDEFSFLLLRMRSLVADAMDNLQLPYYKGQVDDRLLEIACDLLAACIKGPSYLYALFLEIIGGHSEWLLRSPKGIHKKELDLSLVDDFLFIKNIGNYSQPRYADWYYRLRLVSTLVKKANHFTHGEPEYILTDGVNQVCDDLLDLVMPEAYSKQGILLRDITEKLCNALSDSVWIKRVKKWRNKRSRDDYDEISRKKGRRKMPRSMRRLDTQVRELLFAEQICMKSQNNKKLSNLVSVETTSDGKKKITPRNGINLYHEFTKAYLGNKTEDDSSYCCPDSMYRHLYDIPYMCALMRVQDLRNPHADISVYDELQTDMPLGRGLYQHALEFFIRDVESAHHRLSRIIPLVIETIKALKNQPEEESTRARLSHWLYGSLGRPDEKNLENYLNWLKDKFKETDRKTLKGEVEQSWVDNYGAIAISLLPFSIYEKNNDSEEKKEKIRRNLEKISGHALDILYKDNAFWGKNGETIKYLSPLRCYLSLRHNQANKKAKNNFYRLMSSAIGRDIGSILCSDKGGNSNNVINLKEVPTYLVSRLSILGSVAQYSPFDALLNRADEKPLGLEDFVWKYQYVFKSETKKHMSTILPLIGRYDALIITETSHPCLCPLPSFKDLYKNNEPDKIKGKENFPIFFGQRESAIVLNLYVDSDKKAKNKAIFNPNSFFAYISVTLSHRGFRLDLIYRLLKAQQELPNSNEKSYVGSLERLSLDLKPGDYAFLTDSYEDVIFAFAIEGENKIEQEKKIAERLDFIFNFQSALYEDFMVDRTEIMLSPECVDAVYTNNLTDKYSIYHRLRTNEDRHLLRSNEELKKTYGNNIRKSELFNEEKSYIRQTPGRMDFTLVLELKRGLVPKESFMKKLFALDENSDEHVLVDRTETALKKTFKIGSKKAFKIRSPRKGRYRKPGNRFSS